MLCACSAKQSVSESSVNKEDIPTSASLTAAPFDADSAYSYVKRQVDFGPRVPNTPAHKATGKWLADELKRHGAQVRLLPATLKAHDGTRLEAINILGSYNPQAPERVLLIAHWDSRPFADMDPDPANRTKPVPGANDGASGVGVLLEIARQLGKEAPDKGVDILFVDAEDWGDYNNENSWALGTQHYVANMPADVYRPRYGILLDMVGGKGAVFPREQFSQYYAPELVTGLWETAQALGYGNIFRNSVGAAVTDDHVEFIRAGIPVIDIIEYNQTTGFNPNWHTIADDMDGIDSKTLGAVGTTVLTWLRQPLTP